MNHDQIDKLAAQAVADYTNVTKLATHFLAGLNGSNARPKGTELKVSGSEVVGSLLGVEITSSRRPVVVSNRIRALEWSFFAEAHGLNLLTIYQWEDGRLTHSSSPYDTGNIDDDDANFICDTNNSYLAKNLIGLMLPKLLDGPIFEPLTS